MSPPARFFLSNEPDLTYPLGMSLELDLHPEHRFVFRKRHRLSTSAQFAAVFESKLRKTRGPITVFLMATSGPQHRLGLSVGRKLGNAVVRGRFKRQIRDAFRLHRESLPRPTDGNGSYDMVVTVRKHDALAFDEYAKLLVDAINAAHRTHEKRTTP